jgi:hypothetical protein
VSGMSNAGTYARSVNAAAALWANQDTEGATAKDVAASVLDLAEKLYKQQLKAIAKLEISDDGGGARSANTGKPYKKSGGGGYSSGMSDKQRAAAGKAIASLGDETPYTMEDLEGMSGDGGRESERSGAIDTLFKAAWGER